MFLECIVRYPASSVHSHTHCRMRNLGIDERARLRVRASWCVARLDISRSFSLSDSQTSRIYGREYTVWAIGTVPHRRTARFLFTSAFTRYQLRDRPRLHFTCSIVSYFWPPPPSPPQPPLYPPYRLVSDKHPIDRKWRDGLREST